ncbi:hypothetical protein NMG60_11025164 [Bertholletia excelsa]
MENSWPLRKNREIMKEVVRTPEISGKLTYPISVKQPGPRESLLQCFIRRNRILSSEWVLHCNGSLLWDMFSWQYALADDGKFLLAARKYRRPTCADYNISLHVDDISKGSNTYVGKLRSNFLGTNKNNEVPSTRLLSAKQIFPILPSGNYPVAHISYELNVLGSRDPRRMNCVMDVIPASAIEPGGVAPAQTEFALSNIEPFPSLSFFQSKSSRAEIFPTGASIDQRDQALQLQCWCLNFHGRVVVASAKNFQLVASVENGQGGPEHDKVILQFGKVGKDVFTMDCRYPLSAFQAFAICLSSFDIKIACE